MQKKILIEKYGSGHAVALFVNNTLTDLLIDPLNCNEPDLIGSIFSARVQRKAPGINGTFVALPNNRQGFIKGKSQFQVGQIIPVMAVIDVEKGKAQVVSDKIVVKGKFVVITAFKKGINFSKKFDNNSKKSFLRNQLKEITDLPHHAGAIIRSAASTADLDEVIAEFIKLAKLLTTLLSEDLSTVRILLSAPLAKEVALRDWDTRNVEFYESENCFDFFGIWEEIMSLKNCCVELPNGGSMIIEQTSALISVDINSGSDLSSAGALNGNIFAVRDLPRQLRLRGLGGKIVIDFAPLKKTDRVLIERELRSRLADDSIKTLFVGWTNLGNLELERKRQRRPLIARFSQSGEFI